MDRDRAKRRTRMTRQMRGNPPDGSDDTYRAPTQMRGWRTEYPEEFPVTVTRIADPQPDAELKLFASKLGVPPGSRGMRLLANLLDDRETVPGPSGEAA